MAKPKLALIPSAQGSKFYSVLPSSGVGDFNFTRSGSATRINSQGLIESVANGVSRLNYPMIDGVVKGCPHHILEPQSTNLLPYSEDFSQPTGWASSGKPSVESNVIISPDGTLNATRLSFGGNNTLRVNPELTFTNDYSYSIFVKKDIGSFVTIYCAFFTTSIIVGFDLDNGTCQTGGVIEKYGNDWYRLSVSKNVTGDADKSGYFYLYSTQTLGSTTSINGNKLYVWGAQVEDSGYPTSYIPTNGSTATRSAETANGSGDASTFNDSEGVLMAEISALDNDLTNRYLSISDGTANNRILIRYVAGLSNTIGLFAVVGGSEQATLLYEVNDILDNIKVLIKYKQNDYSLWVNGFEVDTDTTGIVPSENTLDRLNFANIDGSTFPFYGNTKQLQYFDTALNSEDLEKLTSWVSFQDMAEGQLYTIE
jgi:hypothetical protein